MLLQDTLECLVALLVFQQLKPHRKVEQIQQWSSSSCQQYLAMSYKKLLLALYNYAQYTVDDLQVCKHIHSVSIPTLKVFLMWFSFTFDCVRHTNQFSYLIAKH